ncbi:MAG: signal peptide peptidase SppA [Pseudomonadota bacterium]
MQLNAEDLIQRRRLQRRITFWRIFAILAVVGVVAALLYKSGIPLAHQQHIARVNISGVITDDAAQRKLLDKLAEANTVKAVILHIDSPGGTTTGGEALYETLQNLRKKKPVIGVFGTIATSAAYIAGLGTDHIVSRGNTITGSVGVIFQWAEVTQLLDTVGVKMNEVKSGTLKATPSPFAPLDDNGKQLVQEMVADANQWFLDLVQTRRKLDPSSVPGLTEGRIYSGRQALKLKLVDEIGGEDKALAWLKNKKGISDSLEIIDWEVEQDGELSILSRVSAFALYFLGLSPEAVQKLLSKHLHVQKLSLNGLVSIWK